MRKRCPFCDQFKHAAGCLEALALGDERRTVARVWSDAENAVVEHMYGRERTATIQRRLYKATGMARSHNAVIVQAQRLGLDGRTNSDGLTVEDAARELGIGRWKIDRLIRKGDLKPQGRGKYRLLTPDDLAFVRALYPATTEPTIGKTEAMKRLGYCESHITRLLLAGHLRGERVGERWRVSAAHVAEMVAEMKRTGQTRRKWDQPPPATTEPVWIAREVVAAKALQALPQRTRTSLVPVQRGRQPDFPRGGLVGPVVARKGDLLVVATYHGEVLVSPDLVTPA